MSGMIFPIVVTTQGAQPQTPASLNAQLISEATTLQPGLTANLPGSLIEDVASTDTGALVLIDQAAVDSINNLTPYGANEFTLLELGQIYLGQGSTASPASNTAVYVVFSSTSTGFPIQQGFIVSDGTNQYTVQDGGSILTGGSSAPLFCLASQSGSFAVPANTVTQLVTSVPSGVALTVTNPQPGTAGGPAQTQAGYRAQVLQAGLAASTGMPRYLKTFLQQVAGVQANLIAVQQQGSGGWKVIVGGTGDPYAIGNAILDGLFDVSTLVGSVTQITALTNANPGVATTNINHGFTTGGTIVIAGVTGTSGVNGSHTVTVISENTFSFAVNTTSSGAYTGGGTVTPNFRNVSVNISDYPDTYTVIFVVPPVQTVTMTITWNTLSSNYVSPTAVTALVQPAIAAYINGLYVGAPINELEMVAVFQAAVSSVLSAALLDRLVFSININGVTTAPGSGTYAVSGDPESYFSCAASSVTVVQG